MAVIIFIKIISHDKKIGYNVNLLQQTQSRLAAFLFNCTLVGRISDSKAVPT